MHMNHRVALALNDVNRSNTAGLPAPSAIASNSRITKSNSLERARPQPCPFKARNFRLHAIVLLLALADFAEY